MSRRTPLLRCVLCVALSCIALWGTTTLATAAPQKKSTTTTVVVSETFRFLGSKPASKKVTITPFRQSITSYVANHTELFTPISDANMRLRLNGQKLFKDRLDLAVSLAKEGIQSYRAQKFPEATDRLEKALKQYDAIHYDLVSPRAVARVILYLSLVYLEQNTKLPQTMALMRRMITLDPSLEIKRGYYADKVVDVYELQRRTILREMKQERPGLEFAEQARFLASRAKADVVLMGFVRPGDDTGYVVSLYVYRTKDARFERGESIAVSSLDAKTLQAAGDRLMSRYASCFHEPARITVGPAPSKGRSPLSISVRYAYATFLTYPAEILDTYDNIGMGIGARWLLTQEFGVVGGVDVLFGQQDRSNFTITKNHPLYRGFLGGELGLDFYRLRLSMQLTGEVTHMADFEIWGSVNCVAQPDCGDQSRTKYDTYGLMLGFNARPVLSVSILDSLQAFGAANISFFFFTGEESEFNFPLGGELGLQYRF